ADDVADQLLRERAKERAFVTSGEIFAAFPELEPETAELAAIYAAIKSRGVEVVDEITEELQREDERRSDRTHSPNRLPMAPSASPTRPGVSSGPIANGQRTARAQRTEGASFDPVHMYLKEIGKIPLLTAGQEVTLAQRIEAGVHAAARLMTH